MDVEEAQKRSSRSKSSSRERTRRHRSRSRSRNNRRFSRSRSISPYRGGRGNYRGGARRFQRRSPPPFRGGGRFRDRFRRSRSTSRSRYDRRRRSRSDESPRKMDNYGQQVATAAIPMTYPADAYANYVPQFPGSMAQFSTYEFQSYPPPAPTFGMNQMGAVCPVPPGITDWQPEPLQPSENEEEKKRREAAIAEEKKRQQEGLKKQREQYINRSEKLKRELKALREQKSQLLDGLGKRSPSPKTNGFIKENEKLQSQISSKLGEIVNVIDMLSGIIGKELDDENEKGKKAGSGDDSTPERIKSELLESMKRKKKETEEKSQKINYIYFDPETHWCKPCQIFPKTAQDYLSHLHTKDHLEKIATRKSEAPWRSSFQKSNEVPSYPDAPTKRTPIKGLQFFEPATAWFCKLCEMFMGDAWCTSLHLKSSIHAERYAKFMEKEPKFEEKWLEARSKAMEPASSFKSISITPQIESKSNHAETNDKKSSDKKSKKKKNKKDSKKKRKRGKKRKHSSSSSDSDDSDSSTSSSESEKKGGDAKQSNDNNKNSIRIAMRNISKSGGADNEKSGWSMVSLDPNKPPIPPPPAISANASKETKKDEAIINQWNTVEPIISQEEKRMLENLKGRLKQKESESAAMPVTVVSRKKSRSKSRSKEREKRVYRGRRSRSRSSPRRRSKSRSRSPRRRSRSRSHSRGRRYGRSRYSRSRSPRGSPRYNRSSRPFIFPTEPKLPPLRDEKKQPARSYVVTKREDPSGGSSALANASKKMPFIGKMPVFKKQLVEKKYEDVQEPKKEEIAETCYETLEERNNKEDWNDLMPDPEQFTAMMSSANAPPPPVINEQPDAPPGLDPEMDSEFIPKPISDAPVLRKGPLPSDFQATLDLLYDGDTPKPVVIEPVVPEIPIPEIPVNIVNDGPLMIMPEELSQHAVVYNNFYQTSNETQPAPPPIPSDSLDSNKSIDADKNIDEKDDSVEMMTDDLDDKMKNQEDMDDLAMLGIDPNDVGSGFW